VVKDYEGLTGMEIAILIKRKMKRYIALLLSDLESESVSVDSERMVSFETVRKLNLDYFNDFTRAVWQIIGVEIEGNNYY